MTLNFKLCAAGGVVAVLLLLTGCGRHDPPKAESRGGDRVIAVEVAQVRHTPVSVTRVYSGSLEGVEQASIVPKLSERITAIAVRVGQRVQAGSKILSLDKGGTSSQYYQALATCENARKTVERMQSLYHEGAIALQSLDGAQTAYAVAKANFEGARSAVELTSPIAGEVTAVSASLGDLSVPGAALATVARIDQMKVTFNMNESDVAALASAQKVRVYSEVQPDARAEGAVFQIAKSADVRSRSFEVKALFANTRE
ncbi:MAG TPA: efflux RND transporter periplasmic adaptor subunit, partial [Bacteroidota bacterium]|nr:efflux RND transporter periplasmic adaptor subunit [Bacteroidota bacterium]